MKVLIVEDDLLQAKEIINHIYNVLGSAVTIIGPYTHYKEVIEIVKEGDFDFAVLDIQLQEDIYAGVHLGETIALLHNIPILFITGISDNKILNQTIDISSCNYIHKPFDNSTIERALLKSQQLINLIKSEAIIDRISYKSRNRDKYWIKEGTSQYKSIIVRDIVFVEAKDKICEFNMIDGTIFKKRATLEKQVYDQMLSSYNNFYKLNRSFIVNLDHIHTIEGRRIVYSNLNNIKIRIPDDQIKSLFDKIGLKK